MKLSFNGILSGNALKLIALIAMTIDHIGLIFFPEISVLRCIGRIAFPIFAYFIAEGAYYTKNYLKYFCLMFSLGILFLIVYYVVSSVIYLSIFITFSIALIYIFLYKLIVKEKRLILKIIYILLLMFLIINAYIISNLVKFDYGLMGTLIPFAIYLCKNKYLKLLVLIVLLLINCIFFNKISVLHIQICSLFSVLLLLMYNGKRGKINLKYLFYFYYPAHLVILYGIQMLLSL